MLVLDTGIIGELLTLTGCSASEVLPELIDTYRRESTALLEGLTAAVAAGDGESMERCAHSLKGNSAILGAVRLPELCDQLQLGGIEGSSAPARMEAIRGAVSEFIDALETLACDVGPHPVA